jgi:hypothetical protein
MHQRAKTIDLRKVGLSRRQWRELRLETKELGVPVEALAQVIIADFIRRERRQRKG